MSLLVPTDTFAVNYMMKDLAAPLLFLPPTLPSWFVYIALCNWVLDISSE